MNVRTRLVPYNSVYDPPCVGLIQKQTELSYCVFAYILRSLTTLTRSSRSLVPMHVVEMV